MQEQKKKPHYIGATKREVVYRYRPGHKSLHSVCGIPPREDQESSPGECRAG